MKNITQIILSTLLLITVLSTQAEEKGTNLFIHPAKSNDLTPKQGKILEYIKSQKNSVDVTTVNINRQAFEESSGVILNFAPVKSNNFPFSSVTRYDKTGETKQWLGSLADSPDSVSFVIHGQNVTGTIQNSKEMIAIKPLGGGLHVIIKQDPFAFPDEHPPEFDDKNNKSKDIELKKDKVINETSEVTVLVAYTNAVAEVVADPSGLIALAIKETNDSYVKSKITGKINLVGQEKVSYEESGNFRTDLNRLSNRTDEYMDELHALRDSTKADIVVLLIKGNSYCGIADAIMANKNSAFAVVSHECATGYYSFGHEIGHLQGARHNLEQDTSTHPFKYGHGYFLSESHIRTIMSYECPNGGCKRINCWSSPQVKCDDKLMGTKEKNDNSRVLTETFPILSKFR